MNAVVSSIQKSALIGLAKWITSLDAWNSVSEAVKSINDNPNMSGEEKRAVIIAGVKEAGWKWANWALNLVIEIAVSVIKMQADQQALTGEK
jgi:hypothetical protein